MCDVAPFPYLYGDSVNTAVPAEMVEPQQC